MIFVRYPYLECCFFSRRRSGGDIQQWPQPFLDAASESVILKPQRTSSVSWCGEPLGKNRTRPIRAESPAIRMALGVASRSRYWDSKRAKKGRLTLFGNCLSTRGRLKIICEVQKSKCVSFEGEGVRGKARVFISVLRTADFSYMRTALNRLMMLTERHSETQNISLPSLYSTRLGRYNCAWETAISGW